MKTLLLAMVFTASFGVGKAADRQTPNDVVLNSFSTQYPQAHIKKWVVKNDTDIAEFKMLKTKQNAFYLPNGTWIKTESEINHVSDLPKPVETNWHQCAFQTWYVEDVKKVESADQNLYAIKVIRKWVPGGFPGPEQWDKPGKSPEEFDLYFNTEGSLLKKVQLN